MIDGNTSGTPSQVNGPIIVDNASPALPQSPQTSWEKKLPASLLRSLTQKEIDALPTALTSQQKANKAEEEAARLATALVKPKPWVEALHVLLGKDEPPTVLPNKTALRDLSNCDFRGLALCNKDLSYTNLTNSNFREVNLTGADLTGSDLRNASFQHAILEDAILTDVKNLTLRQVGGANLQNIQPSSAVVIDASAQVDEGLKNAGKLYLTTISICLFSVLVVLATKDVDIIMGTGETKLPLIDLKIPTGWFFVVTPALILVMHLTLHLHLLRAWEAMLDLPAIYPDGRTIDRKVNPMLLNSIVLLHWPRLNERYESGTRPRSRSQLSPFTFTQAQLCKLTVYWTAPATLFMFWGRYLVKQSDVIVVWHLVLLFLAILSGRLLRLLWFCTLRTRSQRDTLYEDWKVWPGHIAAFATPFFLFWAYFMAMYSPSFQVMIQKFPVFLAPNPQTISEHFWMSRLPLLNIQPGHFLRDHISADLARLQITTKPSNWIDRPPRGDIPFTEHYFNWFDGRPRRDTPPTDLYLTKDKSEQKRWTDWSKYRTQFDSITRPTQLSGLSFRYARFNHAYMVQADLSKADMNHADMNYADLSGANLTRASLTFANLNRANLNFADMNWVNLNRANLIYADLSGADLGGANLSEADLSGTNLNGADLSGTNLTFTHLRGANLNYADLSFANLSFANLNYAHLSRANLSGANLNGANLSKANLSGALYIRYGKLSTRWPKKFDPFAHGAKALD